MKQEVTKYRNRKLDSTQRTRGQENKLRKRTVITKSLHFQEQTKQKDGKVKKINHKQTKKQNEDIYQQQNVRVKTTKPSLEDRRL